MKDTPIDWLFLMLNNPNQNQDFSNKLYNKAKQLEDNFAIGFYEFVNNEFVEIKGMYDYKNTSYWNFNGKTLNDLLEIYKHQKL
jgi:hypothetical protein